MTARTTPTTTIAIPDTDDLPAGWTWWEHTPAQWTTRTATIGHDERPELVVGEEVVGEPRTYWTRTLGRAHLRAATEAAVRAWRDDDPATADLMGALPAGWRSAAMAKVGYSALGHGELLGLGDGGPEDHLEQTTPDRNAPDHLAPRVAWSERVSWNLRRLIAPAVRVARAAGGTPVPAGWAPGTHDQLSAIAPLEMDFATARRVAESALATSMTTVVVSPGPGERWTAYRGIGGHALCVGVRASRDEAVALATVAIESDRHQLAWLEHAPVRVVEARSPGWDAMPVAG